MLVRPWGNSPTSITVAMFVASENIGPLPDGLSISENNEQSRAAYHVMLFSLFGIRQLDQHGRRMARADDNDDGGDEVGRTMMR